MIYVSFVVGVVIENWRAICDIIQAHRWSNLPPIQRSYDCVWIVRQNSQSVGFQSVMLHFHNSPVCVMVVRRILKELRDRILSSSLPTQIEIRNIIEN